ncbi:MAG TPA: hypothetical protein DCS93_16530 [Microscillaceae bacterium]|nr:hypothetical protein [Microscillaceae bacterium]
MKYIFTIIGLLAIMFAYGQSDGTSALTDSLIQKIDKAKGLNKVVILNKLSSLFLSTNPQKSIEYAQKAINTSQEINFKPGAGRGLNNIGQAQLIQGNYVNALAYYLRALNIFENERQEVVVKDLSFVLSNIAGVYYQRGYFERALKYQLNALKLQENFHDQAGIGASLDQIGSIYAGQKMFVKALENYNHSLNIHKKLDNNQVAISKNLCNIGQVYFMQNKYAQALDFYKRAFELIANQRAHKTTEADLLENIGKVYQIQGDLSNAISYFKKSLDVRQVLGNKDGISANLNNLAEVYLASKKYPQALNYAERSLALAKSIKSRLRQKNAHYVLSEVYAGQQQFDEAYQYQKLYNAANDSLYNESRLKQLAELQAYYELEKKEEENKGLKIEKENLEQKASDNSVILNNKQLTIYALVTVILLGTAILLVLYNRARFRKSLTDELEQKVNERTAYLKKITDELTRANHELDTFLYKASHDLKGPLSSLEGLCHVGLMEKDERKGMYFNMQREVLNRMQLLLFRIVEIGDIRGHQPDLSEEIKLKKYLKSVVRSMRRIEGYKNTSFSVDVDDKLTVTTDAEMLDIVLDNIIKNAVQHANSYYGDDSPHIRLLHAERDHFHEIKIIDNGSGMPPEIAERIFEMFFRGTDNFKGFGLGLYKAKIAVSKLGGEITLLKANKGETIFSVTIPKTKVITPVVAPPLSGLLADKHHHVVPN